VHKQEQAFFVGRWREMAKGKVDYKEFLDACKNEAIDQRSSIAEIWDECWDMYRNQQDYSKKEAWQSKVCLPEAMGVIRKAQSIIKTPLTGDFYNVTGGKNPQHLKARLDELMRSTNVNFVQNIVEAIGSGLVFGIAIMKVTYRFIKSKTVEYNPETGKIEKVTKEKPVPCYEVKDPRTTFFLVDDPTRFMIEEEMYPLSDVLTWADDKSKGYDKKQIKEMAKVDYGTEPTEEVKARLRDLKIEESTNLYRKQVLIQRYYGDVTNENGEVIHQNCYFELANGEYLILPPKENPYWHGKIPFISCSPLRVLCRKTGQSLLEGMRTIQTTMNNIVNMMVDGLKYELLGIPEIDTSKVLNPAELGALVPGRLIRRTPGAAPGPAVTIERPTSFSNAPLHMLEILRRAAQNSHFVTDILMGLPTVKGEQATATEIMQKGGESTQAFQGITNDFEDFLIVPAIEMTTYNILQYDDFLDTALPELTVYKNMTRAQRVGALQGEYKFEARGISNFLEMQQNFQRIVGITQMLAKIPYATLAVRWPKWLAEFAKNSRLPHYEELFLSEKEFERVLNNEKAQEARKEQIGLVIAEQGKEKDRQAKITEKHLEGQYKLQEVKAKGQQAINKEIIKMMGEPEPEKQQQQKGSKE
jgi:hypothetical protein